MQSQKQSKAIGQRAIAPSLTSRSNSPVIPFPFRDQRPSHLTQMKLVNGIQASSSAFLLQLKDDMPLNKAQLLHQIRQDVTSALWPSGKKVNSEIQVTLEGTKVVVGWNIGNSASTNPPELDQRSAQKALNGLVQGNAAAYNALLGVGQGQTAVTEMAMIKTSSKNTGVDKGKAIHAESVIIHERIGKMLDDIIASRELQKVELGVMGKKAACKECGNLISRLGSYVGVTNFLVIQIPDDNTFEGATGDEATHGSNSTAWQNPMPSLLSKVAEAKKVVKKIPPGTSRPDGLNYDKLNGFLYGIEQEARKK